MSILSIHSPETAPEASRPFLENAKKRFGFSPNILGALAESPAALEGYLSVAKLFSGTSFTATERQIVLIAASAKNGCAYCVAAHSTIAAREKVAEDVIAALRDGEPIAGTLLNDAFAPREWAAARVG